LATYTAKDITVLEGLEPVRKRPGMYIGGVGSTGLHHLVWEILDNAVDEAMNGYASNIAVTLHQDGASVTVTDDGRGIPIDKHPKTKKSAIEVIFTTLHAGGKFEAGNYKTAGGLHGVGASVVNALSRELVATVKRDGHQYQMTFKQGKPTGSLKKIGAARGTGTTVYFKPDPQIFPKVEFDAQIIRERLEVASYLHRGVKVIFEGGTTSVVDGPFTEAKEIIGGFWMLDVKSKEEAVEWAKRVPVTNTDFVELRQVFEMEDFPEDVQRAADNATVKAAVEKHSR